MVSDENLWPYLWHLLNQFPVHINCISHTRGRSICPTHGRAYEKYETSIKHMDFFMFFFPANLFERSQFDSLRPIHVSGNRWWWQSCRILRLITKKLLEILFGPEVAIRIGPKLDRKKKWQQHMQTWVFFLWSGRVSFSLGSPFWKKSMERSIPALTDLTIFQRLGRFW